MKQAQDTGTLHILNKAPGHPRFATCLSSLSDQDTLVLTENAVLALADAHSVVPEHTVALEADLEARGISGMVTGAQKISPAQLVGLTEHHSRIISW